MSAGAMLGSSGSNKDLFIILALGIGIPLIVVGILKVIFKW